MRVITNVLLFMIAVYALYWLWLVYNGQSWLAAPGLYQTGEGIGRMTEGFGRALCKGWGC